MSSVANRTVVRLKDFRAADARDVGGRVSGTLNAFTAQVADSIKEWQSKAHSAAKATDGFVRSSPWQAVGAIALAGVAAGVLVSLSARRARRKAQVHDAAEAGAELSGG